VRRDRKDKKEGERRGGEICGCEVKIKEREGGCRWM
jgi:hypothetical protein